MSNKLLPCPFCGCAAEIRPSPDRTAKGLYFAICAACDLIIDQAFGVPKAEAIEAWNTRVPDPFHGKVVAALQTIVERADAHATMVDRGAGGTPTDKIMRSHYNGIPVWPIEDARALIAEARERHDH